MEAVIGKVYQAGDRWHGEIGGGWWLPQTSSLLTAVFDKTKNCMDAGTRQAAIKGVKRIYEQEWQRMDNG